MAKIMTIKLDHLPSSGVKDKNTSEITVLVTIKFDPNDALIQANYQLHLLLVSVKSSLKIHDSLLNENAEARRLKAEITEDELYGYHVLPIKRIRDNISMTIERCFIVYGFAQFPFNGIKACATIVSTKTSDTKWSNGYFNDVLLK